MKFWTFLCNLLGISYYADKNSPKPQGQDSIAPQANTVNIPQEHAKVVPPANVISLPQLSEVVMGIDVSKWQAGIDWKQVAALGYKFAYAKATDGRGFIDPEFLNHRAGAKEAGLLFGGYHFFRFNFPIQSQIDLVLKAIGPGELPFAIDVEWDKYSKNYGENKSMDEAAADMLKTFMALLVGHGLSPAIYTNYYFFFGGKNPSQFSGYPLWISNYEQKDISGVPIPKPWSRAMLWQKSESLTIGSITQIDTNQFMGSFEELNGLVRG